MVRMMMMMILMAWLSDQLIEQTLQNMRRTTKWFVFSERRSLFTRLHHLSGNTEEQCNMSSDGDGDGDDDDPDGSATWAVMI